jgi:hypothetical protein
MAVATVDKFETFEGVGYRPHIGQLKIHHSKARHRIASCGRRFGKSKAGGHELVPKALETWAFGDKRHYWLVGPNYDDDEKEWREFWDACKKLQLPFDKPGTYNDGPGGNMRMSLWDGLFIVEAKSAQYPDSLDGEGLDGVLLVEAAKLKPKIWHKYIRPALADKRGWSLATSTPEGKNWFYEMWLRGQNPEYVDWASWRMPSWVNNVVFPGGRTDPEIVDMSIDMSGEKFNQEIGADFTEFVGRVFKDFDEEIHVGDFAYNPSLPLYAACDYGWTNPFVWILIQTDVWDNVYVIGEYRAVHKDINDIAADLLTWRDGLSTKAIRFFPDPSEPGDSAVLEKALRVQSHPNTGGELKWRLELIRQHLKLLPEHAAWEDRKPRLFFDRSINDAGSDGMSGIQEMLNYRYPESKEDAKKYAPEEPLKKDDHFPEALGRFFRGHFGSPLEIHGQTKVKRGNMSRGRAVHR